MTIRPYILADSNWKSIAQSRFEVAVLPWGATEAHNLHLPYGTDTVQAEHIAAESARRATAEGASVVVLPAIPFGVQSGQLDIPFCLHVNPSTQAALLSDLAESLERHGVNKLVLLNGHGGNDFRAMIRELQPRTSLFLCSVDWYRSADARAYFDEPGDHAGELETSVMMHIAPELVLPLGEAGSGAAKRWRIAGLREGWAWAPRAWTQVSADTGVGNPQAATAEKGGAFVNAVSERIARFLVELSALDPRDAYEDDSSGAGPDDAGA